MMPRRADWVRYATWAAAGAAGIGLVALVLRPARAAATLPPGRPAPAPGGPPPGGGGGPGPAAWFDHSGGSDGLLTGTEFLQQLGTRTGLAREQAIEQALLGRQLPAFLRELVPVPVRAGALAGTIYVTPDFMGVGVETDWVRTPMYPTTAQRVADAYGMLLPTEKMARDTYAAAQVKTRMPYFASSKTANATYAAADARTDDRIAGRRGLADGHRKYVLASDRGHPRSVIIFGAENPDTGRFPLQPYSYVHADTYVDYSHGVRLVAPEMDVAGRGRMRVADVMADAALAPLVSSRAADRNTRYRTS